VRALVIYRVDIADIANQGVSKKMQGHIYGLSQNGFEVDVIYLSDNGLYLNNELIRSYGTDFISEGFFKTKGFYKEIIASLDSFTRSLYTQ